MLGYGTADDISEYLVVMKDPYLRRRSGVEGDPDIWVLRDGLGDIQSSQQRWLFAHPSINYQLFLVTENSINIVQVYPAKYQVLKAIVLSEQDNYFHYTDAALQNEYIFLVGSWQEDTIYGFGLSKFKPDDFNRVVSEHYNI